MRYRSIAAIAVLLFVVLPACKESNVRRFSYENATIKYRSAAGVDDEIVKEVLHAYLRKVGVVKNASPISIELLPEEWRQRCLSTEYLRQALREYCGAEFLVTRTYTVGGFETSDRRFILKTCKAGQCDFNVSGNFAVEE